MINKLLKNKQHFVYQKNFFTEIVYDKAFANDQMLAFFNDIESYLEKSDIFFKNTPGDTSTVAKVIVGNEPLVVKRYNIKNLWHGLKLQFRKSHGFRSFCYAFLLPKHGVPTIKPIAVIQKKYGLLKKRSYFISRYEDGMPGCLFFRDDSAKQDKWQDTINLILAITKKMRESFIYHGDFHFGNFLIVDKRPILLDFDRVKIVKNYKRFIRLHSKDLKNFSRYLRKNALAHEFFKKTPENCYF